MKSESYPMEIYVTPVVAYRWGNPFQFKQTVDAEMRYEQKSRGSSGRGPHRDPRDAYVLVSTVLGIIICCIIGAIIGARLAGLGGIFLGLVAGMFIGGIGGSYTGELLKRRHIRKQYSKYDSESTDPDSKGPFIE